MVQIGDMTVQDEAVILPASFGGSFTRDLTLAAGNVSYTGIGFRPSSIHFLGAIDGNGPSGFIGMAQDKQSGDYNIRNNHNETANTWQRQGNRCINITSSSGNEANGFILSYDADGFTVTWAKFGSPTGTLSVTFIAYK